MRSALLIVALLLPAAAAEPVDRIAVIVGDEVITRSVIRRQIRLFALLRNEPPDYSPASMRETADQLIRQIFVRKEIELSRYTPPAMDEVEKQIEANLGRRGPEFVKALEAAGFSELDLKETFLTLVSFTRFVSFRFNPGVTVSDGEIRNYYESEYVPQRLRESRDAPVEPLEEVQSRIVRVLEARKANAALDVWLEQAKQQVKIRYIEEAFQ